MTKLKNLCFLKQIFPQVIKKIMISTKSDELSCNTSGSPLDMLTMGISHDPTNNNKNKEVKISNNFTISHCSNYYF